MRIYRRTPDGIEVAEGDFELDGTEVAIYSRGIYTEVPPYKVGEDVTHAADFLKRRGGA
jgi:hypothetical protein